MNFKNITPTDVTTTVVNLALGYFVGFIILVSTAVMLERYYTAWENIKEYNSLNIVETGQYHVASLAYNECVALETDDEVLLTAGAECERVFKNVERWKDYRYPGPGFIESLFMTLFFGGLSLFVIYQIISLPFWTVAYLSKSASFAYLFGLMLFTPMFLSFMLLVSAGWQNSNVAWKDSVSVRTSRVYITDDDQWYKAPNTLWDWGDGSTMQKITGPERE